MRNSLTSELKTDEPGSLGSLQRVLLAPVTDPVKVAQFPAPPPKRQETSIIQVGKWLLSQAGLLLNNSCMQYRFSTPLRPKPLPMAWNAVLCLRCPGLHLGSGHQYLSARTPALDLPLACLSLPICHLPAPAVSSLELLGSMALQTLYCSRVVGRPPGPQKSMCSQGGHRGPVVWPLPLPQSPSIHLFLSRTQQAASLGYSGVGSSASHGKGNDSGLEESLQVGGGQKERDLY